jgi:hypothetical protein
MQIVIWMRVFGRRSLTELIAFILWANEHLSMFVPGKQTDGTIASLVTR